MMGWIRDWKRKRVLARHAVDDALWTGVVASLPFMRGLSPSEEHRLKDMAVVFLAEKELTPLRGVRLGDQDRLSIAIQACLPILELGLNWYDGWVGVLVYPGDFRVKHEELDEHGVLHEWEDELAGESWEGGPVVLSWDAVTESGPVGAAFATGIPQVDPPMFALPIAPQGQVTAVLALFF